MNEHYSGTQFAAMMIAAIGMTFLAAALAVSVIDAPSVAEGISRILLAAGSFVVGNFAFRAALTVRELEQESARRRLTPVRVQVEARRRSHR